VQALRRYEGLRDRLRAELGVKPAPETIRLYEAIRDRAAEEPVSAVSPVLPSTAEMPLPERPAVAVLPFENLSGDADQQYFSDGISEDYHHRAVAVQVAVRDRATLFVCVQGPAGQGAGNRAGIGRGLCGRGQFPPGGRQGAHQRATGGCWSWHPAMGGKVRLGACRYLCRSG
ncbi:MAG: hypothetical protein E5W25_02825, partial [Mesorhizobium sp.]